MVTCRFGIRHYLNGGSDCFEVFDRVTGVPVASGLRRAEAEADARRRNHDTSGPELAALLAAIDAYLASVGHRSRILVARAAQALDELHDELDRVGSLIAQQQVRIGELYRLLPEPGDDDSR